MKHRFHFARQRRQLIHLGKRLARLRAAGRRLPADQVAKFRTLLERLTPRLGRRGLRRALGASALVLGLSFGAGAQIDLTFDAPRSNPFGLDADRFAEAGYTASVLADLDNDGDLDLLTQLYSGDLGEFEDLTWAYQENIGTASAPRFAPVAVDTFGLSYLSDGVGLELVDIDGDGDLDLLEAGFVRDDDNGSSSVEFILRKNIGTATAPQFSDPQRGALGIDLSEQYLPELVSGDLDGDGDVDLLIQASSPYSYEADDPAIITFYRNDSPADNSDIVFTAVDAGLALGLNLEVADGAFYLSDLDEDGDLDLLVRELITLSPNDSPIATLGIGYVENRGTAQEADFGPLEAIPSIDIVRSDYPTFAVAGDLDGDGDLDILQQVYGVGLLYYANAEVTSTREAPVDLDLRLSPNPTSGSVDLTTPEEFDHIELVDGQGRLLRQLDGSARRVDLSTLPPGVYTLRFVRSDGRYGLRRVVKQ